MEFFEVVKKRYSHKVALDPSHPVPDEHLVKIAEAGIAAPSAGNGQSAEFILINDKALIAQIGEITHCVPLKTAPAMIALVSDLGEGGPGVSCCLEDYAAATENMLLAATALGYSCGWVDGLFKDPAMRNPVSELLNVPDDRRLMVIVPVGLPGEPGPRRPKKPFERRASWNRYAVVR
jgi:nitroreductase